MIRKLLFLTIVVLINFAFSHSALAEAVYLKNGSVMIGKIVGGDKESILLQTGSGEVAVTVTIFLNDIIRVVDEEAYFESLMAANPDIYKSDAKMPWEIARPVLYAEGLAGGADYIKGLIVLNRQASERSISGAEEINPQKAAIPVPFSANRMKPKKGDGSISGYVRLPDIIENTHGDLYVYLMEAIGKGHYFTGNDILYQKINAKDIKSLRVDFKIEHVPEGNYMVFAAWDVAPPPIQVRDTESGKALSYLGFKGDYRGSTDEAIPLRENENNNTADVNCVTYIWTNETFFAKQEKPKFDIVDLYFQKLPGVPTRILMSVKNRSDFPVHFLAADVYINNEKITSFPMDLGSFAPMEEKEVDITGTFEVYAKLMVDKDPEVFLKPLLFKITWPSTGEVMLEKATPAYKK